MINLNKKYDIKAKQAEKIDISKNASMNPKKGMAKRYKKLNNRFKWLPDFLLLVLEGIAEVFGESISNIDF